MVARCLLFIICIGVSVLSFSQQKAPSEYSSGLRVDLNEDRTKYFRLITWHQVWLNMQETAESSFRATPALRRSRFLIYAQLNEKFLILTHFGLNNLTPAGLDPTGKSPEAQLFMHGAWVEYKVLDALYLGGGLHYWNGISRLNNQSTLNFLPIDNPRHAWATIGTTDQFGRHLGVYLKGDLYRLHYRFAWNSAMHNSIDTQKELDLTTNKAVYRGRELFGEVAQDIFSGYAKYQFWEKESSKLPYEVGNYLGGKKIFNIGSGFYSHPDGSVVIDDSGGLSTQHVMIWALDAFLALPIGATSSLNAYLMYQHSDYGLNYQLGGTSQDIFSGSVIYLQSGYLLPNRGGFALQPYLTITGKRFDVFDNNTTTDWGLGFNGLISQHHAKVSLEYRRINPINDPGRGQLILQAAVFL